MAASEEPLRALITALRLIGAQWRPVLLGVPAGEGEATPGGADDKGGGLTLMQSERIGGGGMLI